MQPLFCCEKPKQIISENNYLSEIDKEEFCIIANAKDSMIWLSNISEIRSSFIALSIGKYTLLQL